MSSRSFIQSGPQLPDPYASDPLLRAYLKRRLPREVHEAIRPDLQRFAQRVVSEIESYGEQAEAQEPQLKSYDAWGRRVDEILVSPAWEALHRVAAEEGLIAIGYERLFGQHARLYQFTKLYLYSPSSAFYACPLAMTDGAARLLELYADPVLKQRALSHLCSRDPADFWTSGQWMTEKQGGSDVGQSATAARHEAGDFYRLEGHKWFTSATTSAMAMTLARIEDRDGQSVSGSRGLSLFYLETRDAAGGLNGIQIDRLKDKLGTRALPTAELTLAGCRAQRVGTEGQGVKLMSSLFNVTRIYNAVIAVSFMRRMLALVRDYAQRREAFSRPLIELPLHQETLAHLEVQTRGAFLLGFALTDLLGKVECRTATADEAILLRLLTPVVKLFTAKEAVALMSEAIEAIGGAAYIEDTRLPKWLRDTQVLAIWEGTTNVLSLDMMRAFHKEGAFPVFAREIAGRLQAHQQSSLRPFSEKIAAAAGKLHSFVMETLSENNAAKLEVSARGIAMSIARIFAATELLDHAAWALQNQDDPLALPSLERWCRQDLTPLRDLSGDEIGVNRALAGG